jgi:hypothetical protein
MDSKMKLVKRVGSEVKAEYPLDAEVLRLGRERARTIPIDDPCVSRRHAEITCGEEGEAARDSDDWTITDLGSTNGTFVNEELLTGSRRLQLGDQVRVGNTVFTYEEVESGRRFRNVVAILIALSTLTGALVAWRISIASGKAGSADGTGLSILMDRAETQTDVRFGLYQNLDAFTAYHWRLVLSGLIAADETGAYDPALAAGLQKDRLAYANLASIALQSVNPDYLRRAEAPIKETFDTDRFLDAGLAEAASRKDLDETPHFQKADQERRKARLLTLATIILSSSVFFYTGASISKSSPKYLLAAMGLTLFSMATLAAVLAEFLVH